MRQMTKITITDRFVGSVLLEHSSEGNTTKSTLVEAVRCEADLRSSFFARQDSCPCNHQRQQVPRHPGCGPLCRVAERHGQPVRRRYGLCE